MGLFSKIGLFITHISPELETFATQAATCTSKIAAALNSPVAEVLAGLVPEGTVAKDAIEAVLTGAHAAANAVAGNPSAVKGILQRAGAEITSLLHGAKLSNISDYVKAFEFVFDGIQS